MATRILGIDPGSRVTGYAILEDHNRSVHSPCCDIIKLTGITDPHDRLRQLYTETTSIISQFQPQMCAIETPVYGKDPLAMLKLGRAQAAIIMAILHSNLPLYEYYPKAVKKAITGSGNASKNHVAYMLQKLIRISEEKLTNDATDALAVAWCHHQKMSDPSFQNHTDSGTIRTGSRRNNWSSFVEDNPERIRKP